jgi:hypothetical protein
MTESEPLVGDVVEWDNGWKPMRAKVIGVGLRGREGADPTRGDPDDRPVGGRRGGEAFVRRGKSSPSSRPPIQAGEKVWWYYARRARQCGVVLGIAGEGDWLQVQYGPEKFVTEIEAIRCRPMTERPKPETRG